MREDYSDERCLGDDQKSFYARVFETWYRYRGGVMTSSQKSITLLLIDERRLPSWKIGMYNPYDTTNDS